MDLRRDGGFALHQQLGGMRDGRLPTLKYAAFGIPQIPIAAQITQRLLPDVGVGFALVALAGRSTPSWPLNVGRRQE